MSLWDQGLEASRWTPDNSRDKELAHVSKDFGRDWSRTREISQIYLMNI